MNKIDQLIDTYFPMPKTILKRKYVHKKDKTQPEKSSWEMLPNIKLKKCKPRNSPRDKLINKYYREIKIALEYNKKIPQVEKIVGCSFLEFKHHIEKQWEPWMNWNNYGRKGWIIDHVYPCHIFDLLDSTEIKICFYYKNLQPLDFRYNSSKKNKILLKYRNHQLT